MKNLILLTLISFSIWGCDSNPDPVQDDYVPLEIELTQIRDKRELYGLWRCVKLIREPGNEILDHSDDSDIFIKGDSLYDLIYPCERYDWNTGFNLKGDTLLFFSSSYKYNDKFTIGKHEDTLVLRELKNKVYAKTYFFVPLNYDTVLINRILNFGFNYDCLEGTWIFHSCSDSVCGLYSKEGVNFQILDKLEIKSGKYKNFDFSGDTLFYMRDDRTYEYLLYSFSTIKKDTAQRILLYDINHKDGSKYLLYYYKNR